MPIHYEIETDALFLEGKEIGLEEGIEKGIEQGREQTKYEFVARLLRQGLLSKEMIAAAADVGLDFVLRVERDLPPGGSQN